MTQPAVVTGSFVRLQTLADATPRIVLDLDCSISDLAALGLQPGAAFALARLTPAAAKQAQQKQFEEKAAPYGQQARALHASGFFRCLEVWRALGSDEGYRAWLRMQPCRACKASPPCHAAHVRSVAAGSGTGIKPEYFAIPLCDHCHNQVQHDKGICALTGLDDKYQARERLGRWAMEAVEAWAKFRVKTALGSEHLNEIPPVSFLRWAQKVGVEQYLPQEYRG
jgi:hypothetical protein